MPYCDDLSPLENRGLQLPLPVVCIGWLSKIKPYATGKLSQEFEKKLYQFCLDQYVVCIMRGFQECEFCGLPWNEWGRNHPSYGENTGLMSIGDGEIRVIGKSVLYAAPALIYHYVVEHNYKPPQEFVDAVLTGPQPGSEEHRKLLELYRKD
jgi:hypothetical protein